MISNMHNNYDYSCHCFILYFLFCFLHIIISRVREIIKTHNRLTEISMKQLRIVISKYQKWRIALYVFSSIQLLIAKFMNWKVSMYKNIFLKFCIELTINITINIQLYVNILINLLLFERTIRIFLGHGIWKKE